MVVFLGVFKSSHFQKFHHQRQTPPIYRHKSLISDILNCKVIHQQRRYAARLRFSDYKAVIVF